jgi:hypothetical protein
MIKMKIQIIDETNGNPFHYFPDDNDHEALRYYRKQETHDNVLANLAASLQLNKDSQVLEVGAGGNPRPSQALSRIAGKVSTLDADWDSGRHTILPNVGDLYRVREKLGKDIMIPALRGRNELVDCYMGDIALIRDMQSELRDKKFDLIYFWGSIHSGGICSSITQSRASCDLGVIIESSKRLLTPINSLKDQGHLLAVSGYFNGHQSEDIQDIEWQNGNMIDLSLWWANSGERRPKKLGFIGQTLKFARKNIKFFSWPLHKATPAQFKDLETDAIQRKISNKRYSFFGKENDYDKLRQAYDQISDEDKPRLRGLGIIDAVFVEF